MKVQVKEDGPIRRELSITIPAETVKREVEQAYRAFARKARVKGYRPGKVPRPVLERHYHRQVIDDVMTKLVNDTYSKAVLEQKLKVVSRPKFEMEALNPSQEFTYRARVEVKPEIELHDYQGIPLKKEEPALEDSEIAEEMERLRRSQAQLVPVEDRDKPQEGDVAIIDYSGPGGKREGREVALGSGMLLPTIEEAIMKMQVGEEGQVEVTYPKDHPDKKWRGKKVFFTVSLKGLKQKEVPPLDDELAKDLGDFETLEELRNKVSDQLREKKEAELRSRMIDQLLSVLTERHPFEMPSSLVEAQQEMLVTEALRIYQAGGEIPSEEDLAKLKQDLAQRAERQVRTALLVEAVAAREKITVSEDEIEERLQKIAGNAANLPRVKAHFAQKDAREDLRIKLREEKALDFLLSHANIK